MSGEPAIDPYDEESELATERELAFMWLADLEARVADLEELLKMPGCWRPRRTWKPAWGTWKR